MSEMKEMEQIIFEMISYGGNAKGLIYEAITSAEQGDFTKSDALLKEADEDLVHAHQIQTDMIQQEASGHHHEVTVLFVHAQDHLMAALELRTMAENLISLNCRLYNLEHKQ